MAKCPVCRGKGYRLRIDDMRFAMAEIVKCESCDGKGVVEPLTEQEYIQTCNTEQLAEVLFSWYKLGRLDVINKHTEVKKDWLIKHLEQPHRKENEK